MSDCLLVCRWSGACPSTMVSEFILTKVLRDDEEVKLV